MSVQLQDHAVLRGHLRIIVRRAGRVVEILSFGNMIMDSARDSLAQLLAAGGTSKTVTQIGFGTDGAPATPNDIALSADAFLRPIDGFVYPATGQVQFDWTLPTTDANGLAIREFGLITSDGALFARKVRAGLIDKQDDISLQGSWTIIF